MRADLYEVLSPAVQGFKKNCGRPPLRCWHNAARSDEDKLRRKIDKAMNVGAIDEEQYRTLTSGEDMNADLYEVLSPDVQDFKKNCGRSPLRCLHDTARSDEDKLRQTNR